MASVSSALPQLPTLSSQQQALLLAALESNRRSRETNTSMSRTKAAAKSSPKPVAPLRKQSSKSSQVETSVQNTPAPSRSGAATFGDGLFGNFLDHSPSFDVDFPQTSDDYFDDYTGYRQDDSSNGDGGDSPEAGDKRKSPGDDDDDDDDDEDGDGDSGKRREGDDKIAKKPGRKLITTEPTTKRKAQNRAAQRAFRERKEKHVKDLEVKVAELEKKSDTKATENTALRTQIDRLQTELKEYKKRLSVASTAMSTSPKNRPVPGFNSGGLKGLLGDFQFDFTKFGDGSNDPAGNAPLFGSTGFQSTYNNNGQNISSQTQSSMSPTLGGYSGQLTMEALNSQFNKDANPMIFEPGLFAGLGAGDYNIGNFDPTPAVVPTLSHSSSSRHTSQSNQSRSESNANSPHSSTGLAGISSAGTSPEPAPPYNGDSVKSTADLSYDSSSFLSNQLPGMDLPSQSLYDFSGIDWLSNQNGGQFDPQLFGEYRESQAAVVGDDAFNSGLFDDPYNFIDLGGAAASDMVNFDLSNTSTTINPSAFETTKKSASTNPSANPAMQPHVAKPAAALMEQVDRCSNGETAQEPSLTPPATNGPVDATTKAGFYMTTQKLWHELQSCPKFLSGDLDIDTLCSELSAKATCSETGMQVPKDVVEKVLWRLAGAAEDGECATADRMKAEQMAALQKKNGSARNNTY